VATEPGALLGTAAATTLVALALMLACNAATGPSSIVPASAVGFPGWLQGPLPALHFQLSPRMSSLLLLAMCALYIVVLLCVDEMPRRVVAVTIVALLAVFAAAPPLYSQDVFSYIGYARLGAIHGLDPYTHGVSAAMADPVYRWISWHGMPSVYGPLWTLASFAIAPLSVAASLWALKGVALASALGCVALLWKAAEKTGGSPARSAAIFGLNPVVAAYAVGGAHNDLLMLLLLTASLYLSLQRGAGAAGAAIAAAAEIKLSALIGLPVLLLGAARKRSVLVGAASVAVIAALVTLPLFGMHAFSPLDTLRMQQELVSAHSLPSELARVFGSGRVTALLRLVASLAFCTAVVVLLIRTRRGMDWIAAAGWTVVALLLTTAWLMPWYMAWTLPFAALARDRRLTAVAVALSLLVIVLRQPLPA
jgi:hypothetical protein